MKRAGLLLLSLALGICAFAMLSYYADRNAPLYQKFEKQWRQDVQVLEESKQLPAPWFDVREVEIYGGTPETRDWLKRIEVPLKAKKPDGSHKLEILVVAWEEEGMRGTLVQYNLVDLKTGNMIYELARTLILASPKAAK